MDRKNFLKKLALGAAGTIGIAATAQHKGESRDLQSATEDATQRLGFNHIPQQQNPSKMKTILHKASTRGQADHGWLKSHHSFSFANYYNPERMNFGALRVLNDDRVAAGRGFGTHPHDNMEIISIPLSGDLEHKDSMGNTAVIKEGDVQVMSAGTGVYHSEYNRNADQEVAFLQIWVFPNKRDVRPRYDQISLNEIRRKNAFYQILSPKADDQGVWIHQNAWFNLGEFDQGHGESYKLNDTQNGLYLFLLGGEIEVAGQRLEKRDAIGIWDTSVIELSAIDASRVLLMEVPMQA